MSASLHEPHGSKEPTRPEGEGSRCTLCGDPLPHEIACEAWLKQWVEDELDPARRQVHFPTGLPHEGSSETPRTAWPGLVIVLAISAALWWLLLRL